VDYSGVVSKIMSRFEWVTGTYIAHLNVYSIIAWIVHMYKCFMSYTFVQICC